MHFHFFLLAFKFFLASFIFLTFSRATKKEVNACMCFQHNTFRTGKLIPIPCALGQRVCYNIWFSKAFHLNWSAQILFETCPFLWAQIIQFNRGGKLSILPILAFPIISDIRFRRNPLFCNFILSPSQAA